MAQLESLMRRNFVDYASYAILDRAIPDLRDGLKPVQRRILHTLFEMHDGRYHKVANVIGETMKLHPHGDASIGDALVVLANKDFFVDRQGNFGNVLTGHPAAAPRYIECRLTGLALEGLFNEALTEWRDSYDGRSRGELDSAEKVLIDGGEVVDIGKQVSTADAAAEFAGLLKLSASAAQRLEDALRGGLFRILVVRVPSLRPPVEIPIPQNHQDGKNGDGDREARNRGCPLSEVVDHSRAGYGKDDSGRRHALCPAGGQYCSLFRQLAQPSHHGTGGGIHDVEQHMAHGECDDDDIGG